MPSRPTHVSARPRCSPCPSSVTPPSARVRRGRCRLRTIRRRGSGRAPGPGLRASSTAGAPTVSAGAPRPTRYLSPAHRGTAPSRWRLWSAPRAVGLRRGATRDRRTTAPHRPRSRRPAAAGRTQFPEAAAGRRHRAARRTRRPCPFPRARGRVRRRRCAERSASNAATPYWPYGQVDHEFFGRRAD